jgi:hypothetical protein
MRQIVINYLHQHPTFCNEYFVQYATRQMVQQWLYRHLPGRVSLDDLNKRPSTSAFAGPAQPTSPSTASTGNHIHSSLSSLSTGNGAPLDPSSAPSPFDTCPSAPLFRSNSCSTPPTTSTKSLGNTPLRKISAHEFEQSTLRLRPIFTTNANGRPSFLPPSDDTQIDRHHQHSHHQHRSIRRDRTPSVCSQCCASSSAPASIGSIVSLLTPPEPESMELESLLFPTPVTIAPSTVPVSAVSNTSVSSPSTSTPLSPSPSPPPSVASESNVSESSKAYGSHTENEIRLQELQLMLDLVKDICDELDLKSLCHKILQNVSVLTNADRCSLFLVKQDLNEKYFVSTLFDVRSDSRLDEQRMCICIPWNTGVVGYVANHRTCVNITDCYNDERFHSYVDSRTGYVTKNMICAPILDHDGSVLGVAQAINKQPALGCTSGKLPPTDIERLSRLAKCSINY